MATKKEINVYKSNSLSGLKPNSIVAVKVAGEQKFELYVTDLQGVPYSLNSVTSGGGGIQTVTNTDGNISIVGANNLVVNISPTLLSVINSALQAGDNISELVNDAGYLTSFTETDPIFQASEASLFIAGDKDKLDGIEAGAEVNVQSDWNETNVLSDKFINNKPTLFSGDYNDLINTPNNTSDFNNNGSDGTSTYVETDELGQVAFSNDYNDLDNLPIIPTPLTNHSDLTLDDGTNPHGTTKSDVGLSNVDNTSDLDKPISTATQNALNLKEDVINKVTDFTTINDTLYPSIKLVNDTFVKKSDAQSYTYPSITGTDAVIPLPANGASTIIVNNSSLTSIAGFDLSLITGNPSAEDPYPGKEYTLENQTNNNITLKHLSSVAIKFFALDQTDLIIPPGKSVRFNYGGSQVKETFKNWSEASGWDLDFANLFKTHYIYRATGVGFSTIGTNAISVSGTASNVYANPFSYYRMQSAATAGTSINLREGSFKRLVDNQGFYWEIRVKVKDASEISDVRGFFGIKNTNIIGNIDPSTADIGIHFGYDGADTQWQLMTMVNGFSTMTKVPLGVDFPKVNNNEYLFKMYRMKNSSTVYWSAYNFSNQATASGSTTYNHIAGTLYNHRNNNTSAVACGFEVQRINFYVSD